MQDRKSRIVIFGIKKFRVINLTQAGLKAMEELEKLEEERGAPGYVSWNGYVSGNGRKRQGRKKRENTDTSHRGKNWQGRQQRDVYVFDFEYFFAAAYSCQYDCLPAAVRKRESGRDYRAGDYSDVY